MIKYSLWIVPDGEIRKSLEDEIRLVADKYKTPVFRPHITVVTDIVGETKDIIEKAGILAKTAKPFTVTFGALGTSQNYFRRLYLAVAANNSFLELATRAAKIYGVSDDKKYPPHLSLGYGDQPIDWSENKFEGKMFAVTKISVYRTDLPPGHWESLAELPLVG